MAFLLQLLKNRYIGLVMVVWVLSLLYMGFVSNNGDVSLERIKLELYEKTMKQLLELKDQNKKLMSNIQDLKKTQEMLTMVKAPVSSQGEVIKIVQVSRPSMHHEILRRRLQNDIRESWFYIHHQLEALKKTDSSTNIEKRISEIQNDVFEYYSITSNDMLNLSRVDGGQGWRREQSRVLGSVVQDVLHKLQNPEDCSSKQRLLCTLDKGCGFGCQLHHVLYCLITAVATNRTLVLSSKSWRYLPDGWSQFFKPPSGTCSSEPLSAPLWSGNDEDKAIIQLPIIDVLNPRPPFLPLAVPSQLYSALVTFHGDPFVWWAGQLLTYLMRPQASLAADMEGVERELGFSEWPHLVGVHIRRTDKIASEAAFHSLEEYMWHVDRYFDKLDLLTGSKTPRAVYMASDDPSIIDEATSKYPSYKVIGSKQFAIKAAVNSRYSKASLRSIILDVTFLSRTQHLVCTFSSQVCRLAYELMQVSRDDASASYTSLDDIYYYGGQSGHKQVARFDHTPKHPGHIRLTKGELVGVAGNHWDGFSMGSVGGVRGLYPSIKVLDHVATASFPLFSEYLRSDEFKQKYAGNEFAAFAVEAAGADDGGEGGGGDDDDGAGGGLGI